LIALALCEGQLFQIHFAKQFIRPRSPAISPEKLSKIENNRTEIFFLAALPFPHSFAINQ